MRTRRAARWPYALGITLVWLGGCAGTTSSTNNLPPVEDLRPSPAASPGTADSPRGGVEVGSIERGPEFVPEPAPASGSEPYAPRIAEPGRSDTPATGSGTYPAPGFEPGSVSAGTPSFAAQSSANASPAVASLLESAGRHADVGELDKSAASLERALRIDPRNASVWHDLGEVRFYQSEYEQAEALAKRSNSLAAANRELRARNWELIERSRRARGDLAGAEAAAAKSQNP